MRFLYHSLEGSARTNSCSRFDQRTEKRRKLFPIPLTDYATLKKWERLDSDTGEDLAEEVRKYHIRDFSNWKNHDAFERAFARLEKDLHERIEK